MLAAPKRLSMLSPTLEKYERTLICGCIYTTPFRRSKRKMATVSHGAARVRSLSKGIDRIWLEIRSISLKIRSISLEIRSISLEIRSISLEIRLILLEIRLILLEIRLISPEIRLISYEIRSIPSGMSLVPIDQKHRLAFGGKRSPDCGSQRKKKGTRAGSPLLQIYLITFHIAARQPLGFITGSSVR
jgi:hypothetical protein